PRARRASRRFSARDSRSAKALEVVSRRADRSPQGARRARAIRTATDDLEGRRRWIARPVPRQRAGPREALSADLLTEETPRPRSTALTSCGAPSPDPPRALAPRLLPPLRGEDETAQAAPDPARRSDAP